MSGGQQPDAVWKIEGPLPQKGDTWVLEASAGTGKTYQIASLVLRLVAEAGVKIEKVLAITFTNAATGELRDRIRARLVEALAALRDPEAYKRKSTEDQDAVATALREAQEEVGLHPRHVHVLGSLPHYTTGSGFVVTPVVALLEPDYAIAPNAGEVDAVFEVPLDFLMNPAHHRRHTLHTPIGPRHWISMPYQDGAHERYIWGATAGMLRNLYRFLLPA
jgi:8-oxo-dGTP pyrophosphatase MutT (NUDIX family)